MQNVVRSLALAMLLAPGDAFAQDAYANLETSRPLRTEDAVTIERYRLDVHLGPVSWEHLPNANAWIVTPSLAYGLLPRTQVEIAAPFGGRSMNDGTVIGLSRVDLSALYALNAETRGYPALALKTRAIVPVGDFGVRQGHTTLAALATRTFSWGTLSGNHEYTFGDEPSSGNALPSRFSTLSVPRWRSSLAADRALPVRALLIGAEVFAQQPLTDAAKAQWFVGSGLRYQLTRSTVFNLGVNGAVSGDQRPLVITLGLSRGFTAGASRRGVGGGLN